MQSVTDLQNTLLELQDMLNITINPVFEDLTNASSALAPVILSHDEMIVKINEMISFLNSGVIQGLKGDKGDQGIQGIQGEQGLPAPSVTYKKLASLKETNTTTGITLDDLTYVYEAGIYEFEYFGTHRTVASTTGVTFQLSVKSGDLLFSDGQFNPSNARTSADVYNAFMSSNIITFTTIAMTAINVACPFVIRGKLIASSSGTLTTKFASEIANSMATIPECHLFIKKIG